MTDREKLRTLLYIHYRNEQYAIEPDDQLLPAQRNFLNEAIALVLQAMGEAEIPEDLERDARETIGIWYASQEREELDEEQERARYELQQHVETIEEIRNNGLRILRCGEHGWKKDDAEATIDRHIHDGAHAHERHFPNWNDEGTATPVFHFGFLDTSTAAEEPLWAALVSDALSFAQRRYFAEKWSVLAMEDLRRATIDHYYEQDHPPPPPPDLDERARDEAAKWITDDNPHYAQYLAAIRARLADEADAPPPDGDNDPPRSAKQREIEDHEGVANDLFVWRLVVLHLRVLDTIGVDEDAPQVTTCCEMGSLVQAVAHLLKYRRCVRWAKCIYKSAGVGSFHDRYLAGLLNKKFAHEHQDQSNTEIGIARRMIRQAHVANFVNYQYAKPTKAFKRAFRADVQCVVDGGVKLGAFYRTESYYTNPPMAPILCAAPPRMGKTAMSLLMASFAVKLGGNVQYGVWPRAAVSVTEVHAHLRSLGWFTKGIGDALRVYAHDETGAASETAKRVHQLANNLTDWVLHIRDQVHALANEESNAQLKAHQENTYPLFYGMNMCVSATLLPAMGSRQLVGSDDSIRDLMVACYGIDRVDRRLREECVVLQPWSFPVGPDPLVPPRTDFPMYGSAVETWYREHYGSPNDRTGHYYGTWLHTTPNREKLESKTGVLVDDALEEAIDSHQTWIGARLRNFTRDDPLGEAPYKPTDAYNVFLKLHNRYSTKYWDEQAEIFANGGPARVVNAPIACLTNDAARILKQASEWMDHPSMVHLDASGSSRELLHPMFLAAPSKQAPHKSGDMDWAVHICKQAWLHMHKDYVRTRIRNDIKPEELVMRYGVTVLVHSPNRDAERIVDVVAKREDMYEVEGAQLVAVTFDPRLPENRFKNQKYTDADLPDGRLQPSALIPVLTPAIIDKYKEAFEAAGDEGLSAYNYLRNGLESNPAEFPPMSSHLYRFDMRKCYDRTNCQSTNDEPYDFPGPAADEGGDRGGKGGEDEEDEEVEEAGVADEDIDLDELFAPEEEENADPDDVMDPEDEPEAPEEVEDGEVTFWAPFGNYPVRRGDINPDVDDAIQAMCGDPGGGGGDDDPSATGGPRITDLNGIALRLCVRGHPTVHAAAKHAALECNIHKIAVVGFKMFDSGTLQATVRDEARPGDRHHYVPRYMSLAPNQTESKGRNLSELYQMIGRGFARMRGVPLPSNWRLDLLASKGTRKLCRLYGNAELLLSQIRNESVEGRKMTLGTVLGSIGDANNGLEYQSILNEPLKGDKAKALSARRVLAVQTGYHRPFRVVRDCLSGEGAPTRTADLLPHELDRTPNILADGLSVQVNCRDELALHFSNLRFGNELPDEPMAVDPPPGLVRPQLAQADDIPLNAYEMFYDGSDIDGDDGTGAGAGGEGTGGGSGEADGNGGDADDGEEEEPDDFFAQLQAY